jgi:hypothetical protein
MNDKKYIIEVSTSDIKHAIGSRSSCGNKNVNEKLNEMADHPSIHFFCAD